MKYLLASLLLGTLCLHAHDGHDHEPWTTPAPPLPEPGVVTDPKDSPLTYEVVQGPNPWTNQAILNDPDNFQFVVVTDRTGGHRDGVFPAAMKKVNLLRPEFVMSVGDLIEGYTDDMEVVVREWDELDGFIDELDMKFFYVPGNHDMTNGGMADIWAERYGPSYYYFIYRDVLFLCLNTEDTHPSTISARQQVWARDILAKYPDVRWTMVFLHKPLWQYEPEVVQQSWTPIEAALQNRKYTVMCGHFHRYAYTTRNDARYIVLATTGGGSPLRGPEYGELDMVSWITMTDDGPVIANLALDGILPQDFNTVQNADFIWGVLSKLSIGFDPAYFVSENGYTGGETYFRAINPTEQEGLRIQVEQSADSAMTMHPASFELAIPAEGEASFPVRWSTPENQPTYGNVTGQATWKITSGKPDDESIGVSGAFAFRPSPKATVTASGKVKAVDGSLADWDKLPYAVDDDPAEILRDASNWDGPEDSRFRFGFDMDENFLYIAVDVHDPVRVVERGVFPWHQDGIEVRVDARPGAQRDHSKASNFRVGKDYLFFAICPGDTLEDIYMNQTLPAGTAFATAETEDGYITEIAIPLKALREIQGGELEAFRVNVAVNDRDQGEGAPAQLWWQPDWRGDKTYSGSGTFFVE